MRFWDQKRRVRAAYVMLFKGPSADKVLADLSEFCRATDTTFEKDPMTLALREGRRQVWLRIAGHIKLTDLATLELRDREGYESDD